MVPCGRQAVAVARQYPFTIGQSAGIAGLVTVSPELGALV